MKDLEVNCNIITTTTRKQHSLKWRSNTLVVEKYYNITNVFYSL